MKTASVFLCQWICAVLLVIGASAQAGPATKEGQRPTVIVVVGAPGEEKYGEQFAQWAELWRKASEKAEAKLATIGLTDAGESLSDLERLQRALATEPKETPEELWIVLIGHGTYDGKQARFNMRGPDLTAADCAQWLEPFRRPLALIDCASSSAPFLNQLSAPGRVVITATKSGYEQNYARFGQYFSEAVLDPQSDLDKDGQTSLLEAFLSASHRVADFYKTEGRLATEHALLDDNGDGRGTPADWFRGIRAVKKASDGSAADGLRAHQFHLIRSERERELSPTVRARRDELELAIAKLRDEKTTLSEEEYYRQLETLLVELARLYEKTESKTAPSVE